MNILLPPAVEQSLTPEAAALHLAIGLFVSDEVSLGRAAEVAGIPVVAMMRELARRKISLHYGIDEFREDLETISKLQQQRDVERCSS